MIHYVVTRKKLFGPYSTMKEAVSSRVKWTAECTYRFATVDGKRYCIIEVL